MTTLKVSKDVTIQMVGTLDLEQEARHNQATANGLLRHATVAVAYEGEGHDPRDVAAWWLAQVTRRGEAVDPRIATVWHLIDKAKEGGQCNLGKLTELVSLRPDSEIVGLCQALHQVRSLAYADDRIAQMQEAAEWFSAGYCGDDGFGDFINGLVLMGEQTYYSILQAPKKMLTVARYSFGEERLSSLADDALTLKNMRRARDLGDNYM